MALKRENDFLVRVPREGAMVVDALIFAARGLGLEDSAVSQLRDAASLPGVVHAFGMPDIHHGYGVPIGSVVATREVVVPAAVGYDINCGMRLLLTSHQAREIDVRALADAISEDIPLGEGKRNVALGKDDLAAVLEGGLSALASLDPGGHRVWDVFDRDARRQELERVEDRGSLPGSAGAVSAEAFERGRVQLGTLGGGNHFIELQEVESVLDHEVAGRLGVFEGQLALMIHSGSRGLGHEVGGNYMRAAKRYNEKRNEKAPSPNLNFLRAEEKPGREYLAAMHAAANYAFVNRALMAALARHRVVERVGGRIWLVYDVTHNMVKREEHGGERLWVHRKGSTRAFDAARMKGTPFGEVGQPALIPGSMGTASYLLVGVESGSRSLFSVNHGAGRTMSRSAAAGGRKGRSKKRTAAVSDEEFRRSMEGIHLVAGNMRSVKEEAPAAYKDIDLVVETVAAARLALPVARLRPRAVLKG